MEGLATAQLRQRAQREGDLGDHAERAFASEEELAQVGTRRCARRAPGAQDAAVGQHHLEVEEQVLHVAVAGGELARRARGHEAADAGEFDRLRPVTDGEAVALDLPLGHHGVGPGPEGRRQVAIVELDQACELAQGKHHVTRLAADASAHTRAAPEGHHGHAELAAYDKGARDVLGRSRLHHRAR